MSTIDLSQRQRRTLTELVNEYQATDSPVSASDLATTLDRKPGTLRNQMSSLRSLDLVEGIPGPSGGYKPTDTAYEALDREPLADAESVTLARNYDRITATVDTIDFTTVHNPDLCRAQVHFQQSVRGFEKGDEIAIGPTPVANLVLGGVIVAVNESENMVILDVALLEAPIQEAESNTA
ncbi:Rrf2 family transcriptional regulator [Natrinema versiforme]|uniref:Winged helix-turn-helix transcription repressor, HrcA DNA-binding domain-containing protein n=1 Tax=Natrinema versiforme JCM 10478 TaxID=1227496 RepID=L9XRK4_9EURY|nr:Rrf2 family transcriptional regulator [Natrinema versiforme]ELY63263.1 winged helix-turn-helix transcription repressor, HrcA DNA-binding domain-containing protein [Natrinema versiforme JCM 10478]